MADDIAPAERLLNLVIALLNTSSRMTKDQVRSSVAGYETESTEAFERKFERDKDALRDLGIPIVTVQADGRSDEIGYRIDPDAYTLGDLELSPAELAVLSLASGFWRDAALAKDADRALTKLRAVAEGSMADDLAVGLVPRVQPAGQGVPVLLDAILERRAVRFTYRAAYTGEVTEREIEPWRVRTRGAGWYLYGFDRGRGEPRSFRLNRVLSPVKAVGPTAAYEIDADALARMDGSDHEPGPEREAVLAVLPERAVALRLRAAEPPSEGQLADRDVLRVPFRSTMELAYEIAGYGPAVLVLDPPELREVVLSRLRAAAALGEGANRG